MPFNINIIFLLVIFSIVFSPNATAQKKSKQTKSKTTKKLTKTISFGVINDRAIDLIKPNYPENFVELSVYGQVRVNVLIDENGFVVSAKAHSGNSLFYGESVKAALKSKFEPLTLSGKPVRIMGVINYIFLPNHFNWLETGYILGNSQLGLYSTNNLIDRFPLGFYEESQLLDQKIEYRNETTKTVIASIQNMLLDDKKSFWLFSVGLNLAETTNNWKLGGHLLNENYESFQNLKILIANPPIDNKGVLVKDLKKFIQSIEQNKPVEGFSILQNLETRFPLTGK